jgi:collagen type III alpha
MMSTVLGMPAAGGMGGPQEMGMFDPGPFMNLPDSLEFDPTMFRPDGGDLNFERDFGQWFNPDDVGQGLDGMK